LAKRWNVFVLPSPFKVRADRAARLKLKTSVSSASSAVTNPNGRDDDPPINRARCAAEQLPLLRSVRAHVRRRAAHLESGRAKICAIPLFTLQGEPWVANVSGAQLLFPLTYIFGDIFTEVYGYGASRRAIWLGFFACAILALFGLVIVAIPPAPDWPHQAAFETVFYNVPRLSSPVWSPFGSENLPTPTPSRR